MPLAGGDEAGVAATVVVDWSDMAVVAFCYAK
jgi:hypothetical protein